MMQDAITIAIDKIRMTVPEDRVLLKEPMGRHTSFRIGGPAEAFVLVNDEEELTAALAAVKESGAEHMLIGNGSNLLVSDEGYPGIMIKLSGDFENITGCEDEPCRIRAGAAALMSRVSAFLTERGLSGFEFASGMAEMGPWMTKIRSTLLGIQEGDIEAPEGWIYTIVE